MRVVHFCRSFSPLSETFIYDYVTELERLEVDNHVVTLGRQNEGDRPFPKVHVVSEPGKLHPSRLWYWLKARRQRVVSDSAWPIIRQRLRQVIAQVSPDVVHAHFGCEGVLIAPAVVSRKIPLVVTFYGYDISRLPKSLAWKEEYCRLWSKVSGVTVLSEDMRRDALDIGCPESRIQVVHLGRNLGDLPERQLRYPIRHFVSVGRLVEKKGHLDAVRAIHHVSKRHVGVRLDIIGEGPLRASLQQLINDLGMNGRVSLLGALSNRETLAAMTSADAFVLCSKTSSDGDKEGTPTVLVEAQMIGLPLVATIHAGIPEMIPASNRHLLASEGDIEEIADRINWLVESKADSIRSTIAAGRNYVASNYDVRTEASKLVSLYHKTLTHNGFKNSF